MHNDSIETLLSRHYGSTASTPSGLEERLHASLRQETVEMRQEEHLATRLRTRQVSRRRAVSLVALGTAGLGILSIGMEGLQLLETALAGQEISQPALP